MTYRWKINVRRIFSLSLSYANKQSTKVISQQTININEWWHSIKVWIIQIEFKYCPISCFISYVLMKITPCEPKIHGTDSSWLSLAYMFIYAKNYFEKGDFICQIYLSAKFANLFEAFKCCVTLFTCFNMKIHSCVIVQGFSIYIFNALFFKLLFDRCYLFNNIECSENVAVAPFSLTNNKWLCWYLSR